MNQFSTTNTLVGELDLTEFLQDLALDFKLMMVI